MVLQCDVHDADLSDTLSYSGPPRGDFEVHCEVTGQVEAVPARVHADIIAGTQNPPLRGEEQVRRPFHEISRSRNRQDSHLSRNVLLERAQPVRSATVSTAHQRSATQEPCPVSHAPPEILERANSPLPHTTPYR